MLLTAWTMQFCTHGNTPQVIEVEILTYASYLAQDIPLHLVYKLMFVKVPNPPAKKKHIKF